MIIKRLHVFGAEPALFSLAAAEIRLDAINSSARTARGIVDVPVHGRCE